MQAVIGISEFAARGYVEEPDAIVTTRQHCLVGCCGGPLAGEGAKLYDASIVRETSEGCRIVRKALHCHAKASL
jgi:hypothetical protein